MNKELEEAKSRLTYCKTMLYGNDKTLINISDLETVLNYISNSISKEVIENKIEELKHKQIGASTGIYGVQVDVLEELLEGK